MTEPQNSLLAVTVAPANLIAWADKIDSRVGPISGRDADCLALLLRALVASGAKQPRAPFVTPSLRARGVGRVGDEPRALLVLLTGIPGDDDIRALHNLLVTQPARLDAEWQIGARNLDEDPAP